jgi:hypothetical protein
MPPKRKRGGPEVVEVDGSDTETDARHSGDEDHANDAQKKKVKAKERTGDPDLHSVSLGQLLANQSVLRNGKATDKQIQLALDSTAVVATLNQRQRVRAPEPKSIQPNTFFGRGLSVRDVLNKVVAPSPKCIVIDPSSDDEAIDLTGSEADLSLHLFNPKHDPKDYLRCLMEQGDTAETMRDCAAHMRAEGIPWIHMSPLHPDEMEGDFVQVIYCLTSCR